MGAGYKLMGLNRGMHEGKTGIWYREWAPNAKVRLNSQAAEPAVSTHHHEWVNGCTIMVMNMRFFPVAASQSPGAFRA